MRKRNVIAYKDCLTSKTILAIKIRIKISFCGSFISKPKETVSKYYLKTCRNEI